MNKLKQTTIALALTAIGILLASSYVNAQYAPGVIDTGTIVYDIPLNDISGKQATLYEYLDQGYMVVIELSLTTCPICWEFHKMGVLENIYKDYGPRGTISAKKIMPVLIECNPNTTSDDLHGKGPNTMGDWVTGVSHPIVDLTHENRNIILNSFFKSEQNSFATPTFLIICPDGKLIYSGQGASAGIYEQMLVEKMEGGCGMDRDATRIDNIMEPAVRLYPNPTGDRLNVNIETAAEVKTVCSISNILGQTIMQEEVSLQHGIQTISLKTSELTAGIYTLSIVTDQGAIQKKFIIKR